MPKETDRLKLPLPLGNENVTRESINGIFEKIDAGVATQADMDTLREAVSQMDIPDASLTQKGKVQLSNKIDGDSEKLAPTEMALSYARLVAQQYVDDKAWQKYKLTSDEGFVTNLTGSVDLNTLLNTGFYFISGFINGPNNNGGAYHVEVLTRNYSGLTWTLQRLTQANYSGRTRTYQRVKMNADWNPWELQTPKRNVWGPIS